MLNEFIKATSHLNNCKCYYSGSGYSWCANEDLDETYEMLDVICDYNEFIEAVTAATNGDWGDIENLTETKGADSADVNKRVANDHVDIEFDCER